MRGVVRRGALLAWGAGNNGRLGIGERVSQDPAEIGLAEYSPVRLKHPDNVVQVSCGSGHSVFLTDAGQVFTCGLGKHGQLGHGDTRDEWSPTLVRDMPPCKYVAAGSSHTLAVSDEGFVFGFGSCNYGQLGIGQATRYFAKPQLVTVFQEVGERIAKVAAGNQISAAISSSGKLFTFGSNEYRSLGHGQKPQWSILRPFSKEGRMEATPRLVNALRNEPVEDIVFGLAYAIAILRSGDVVGWGSRSDFAFGDPFARFSGPQEDRLEPTPCKNLTSLGVKKVVFGNSHALAIRHNGEIYGWGTNEHGCLGSPHLSFYSDVPRPLEWFVENLRRTGPVRDISAGLNFSVAACDSGLMSWGQAVHGKLGLGSVIDVHVPSVIYRLPQRPYTGKMISSGVLHNFAIE